MQQRCAERWRRDGQPYERADGDAPALHAGGVRPQQRDEARAGRSVVCHFAAILRMV
jgi:hypothetical protein